ncbi:MAG: preprotein translocase subunit SecG [Clostridia bacterium]|nr:preprotein translocase subunit SecG [Clostridia bacterium]MBQ1963487.1 preprotein translocase subunit SecG [Clostridia bacterium]MBQ5834088.1 preprotein translocase subunit SecG [Clostridia bacterium]
MIISLAATANAVWQYVIGACLLLLSVVLVAIILKQTGKDKSLSGTIAGGAETFYGQSKGTQKDRFLQKLTIILSVVFVILTVVLCILTIA